MDIRAFENTENWERIWWKCLEYKIKCLAERSGLGRPLLSCPRWEACSTKRHIVFVRLSHSLKNSVLIIDLDWLQGSPFISL